MEALAVRTVSILTLVIVHLVLLVEIVKLVSKCESKITLNNLCTFFLGDPCVPNQCRNGGRCRPNVAANTYVCECPVNFVGINCETSK